MLTINPKETKHSIFHSYLVGSVAPRPIAFASTIDKDGNPNLSPFSFFNIFSSNPPIAIFSPARSGRTAEHKNTFLNLKEVPEVVINVVNYPMVQQMSLSSTEYPKGVNEFIKSGFTPVASELVRPFRVRESPVQLECKVNNIIELGTGAGSGNLIICEILLMHINEDILDENKHIDPQKIDLVARMGASLYCRASGDALFEVEKPVSTLGIGVDGIPEGIRNSAILTGNNLGQLGNIEKLPSKEEITAYKNLFLRDLFEGHQENQEDLEKLLHIKAKELLDNGKVMEGWKTLLAMKSDLEIRG